MAYHDHYLFHVYVCMECGILILDSKIKMVGGRWKRCD